MVVNPCGLFWAVATIVRSFHPLAGPGAMLALQRPPPLVYGGECVNCEHVRHDISGIAHQGRTVVEQSRTSHAR